MPDKFQHPLTEPPGINSCFIASFHYAISPLQDCKYNLCSLTQNSTLFSTSCRVIPQWIFSNYMFTYLWNDIFKNLVVKSVVLNLFSLLSSSSSSSLDASSFGCVVILSLYLKLNFVIYSLIVGTFKSVCNTVRYIPRSVYYSSEDFILISR
jgi:hypothetical protein